MNTSHGHVDGDHRGTWLTDEGTAKWCLVLNEEDWAETRQDCQRILQAMSEGNAVLAALLFAELLRVFPSAWQTAEIDWDVYDRNRR